MTTIYRPGFPILLVLALASLSHPEAEAAAVRCRKDLLIKSCDDFRSLPVNLNGHSQLGIPRYANGAGVPNFMQVTSSIQYSRAQDKALRASALKTAELVRRRARAVVIGNSDIATLTAEQKTRLARLEKVKFKIVAKNSPYCSPPGSPGAPIQKRQPPPRAFYRAVGHAIEICESTALMAPPILTQILAHEIGHAAGLCYCTLPLQQLVGREILRPERAARCLQPRNETEAVEAELTMVDLDRASPTDMVIFPRVPGEKLRSCGLAKSVVEAQPEASQLFSKTQSCLDGAYRKPWMQYRERKKEFMKEGAGGLPAFFASGGANPISDSLQCHSGHDEHWADVFAVRVIHEMIAAGDFRSDDVRTNLIFLGVLDCAERDMQEKFRSLGLIGPEKVADPTGHLSTDERIGLAMTDPLVQSILGCSPDPEFKICGFSDGWGDPPSSFTSATSSSGKTLDGGASRASPVRSKY